MIDVVNLQRKIKLDTTVIRKFADLLSAEVHEAHERTFSVAFISDSRMMQLNEMFRGVNKTTDVLSFPHESDGFNIQSSAAEADREFLGDIVISAEQAQKQASENNLPLEDEIKQLILHGLLHLCGHDHETDSGEMNSRELKLRDQLGI
jgi:probable rRNA maturation factor